MPGANEFPSLRKYLRIQFLVSCYLMYLFIDMYILMDECALYNYADGHSLSCLATTIDAVISNRQYTELSSGLRTTECGQIPKSLNSLWFRAMKIEVEVLFSTIVPVFFQMIT